MKTTSLRIAHHFFYVEKMTITILVWKIKFLQELYKDISNVMNIFNNLIGIDTNRDTST